MFSGWGCDGSLASSMPTDHCLPLRQESDGEKGCTVIDTCCVPGTELGTIHVEQLAAVPQDVHTHSHTHSRTNSSLRPPTITKGSTQTQAFMSNRMRSRDKEGIHIAPPQQTLLSPKSPAQPLAPSSYPATPGPCSCAAPAKTLCLRFLTYKMGAVMGPTSWMRRVQVGRVPGKWVLLRDGINPNSPPQAAVLGL